MHYVAQNLEHILYISYFIKPLFVFLCGLIAVYVFKNIVFKKIKQHYPNDLPMHVFVRIGSYLLYFLIAAIVLQSFGINMTALIGAAGIFGVAVGFAAQTSVANIISGLFLTFERPFDINDVIVIDGVEGYVQTLDLFAVTLRTSDNKLVRIPNEKVLKNNIINISKHKMRRFDAVLDFVPDANLQLAFDLLRSVVKASDYALHDQEPYIVVSQITGSYVRVHIGVWTTQQKWQAIRMHLLPHLKYVYDQHDIKLAVTAFSVCASEK